MNTQAMYRGCKYVPGNSKPVQQVLKAGMYRGNVCTYTAEVPMTSLKELACYRGVPFYVKRLVAADRFTMHTHAA